MKLSIVIPVYNEEKTIENLLKKVQAVSLDPVEKEIIVVNDHSTDSTAEKLQKLKKDIKNLLVIAHAKNQGKGAAVRTGFKHATGDYLVIQDADLEYDPQDLVRLFKPIQDQKAQVVYGTRLKRLPHLGREERTIRFFFHYFGNRFLSLVTSILYGQWITDMETCYKIFPRKALSKFRLSGNGFDFEPEITAKLLKKGYRILEIPITVKPRGYSEGKKLHAIRDGIIALKTLLKNRLVE